MTFKPKTNWQRMLINLEKVRNVSYKKSYSKGLGSVENENYLGNSSFKHSILDVRDAFNLYVENIKLKDVEHYLSSK